MHYVLFHANPGEARSIQRKLAGLYFPNGDPTKNGCMEVYVPFTFQGSRDAVVSVLRQSLQTTVFYGFAPIINRNRWRGLYSGLGAYGLQHSLWGIGQEFFVRFSRAVASRKVAASARAAQPEANNPSLISTFLYILTCIEHDKFV